VASLWATLFLLLAAEEVAEKALVLALLRLTMTVVALSLLL
jgi:hypothetical protein